MRRRPMSGDYRLGDEPRGRIRARQAVAFSARARTPGGNSFRPLAAGSCCATEPSAGAAAWRLTWGGGRELLAAGRGGLPVGAAGVGDPGGAAAGAVGPC